MTLRRCKLLAALLVLFIFATLLQSIRISNVHRENANLIIQVTTLEKRNDVLQTEFDENEKDLANYQTEIETLRTDLHTLYGKIEELESQNAKLLTQQFETQGEFSGSIGATGRCNDGTETFAQNHQGACSWHGGVAFWY